MSLNNQGNQYEAIQSRKRKGFELLRLLYQKTVGQNEPAKDISIANLSLELGLFPQRKTDEMTEEEKNELFEKGKITETIVILLQNEGLLKIHNKPNPYYDLGWVQITPYGIRVIEIEVTPIQFPSVTRTLTEERGTQHSMWPTGKFEGDNVKNVFWQCNSCGIRIPTKEEAIRHVRREHQEGVITPHLNEIGQQLATVGLFPHATKPFAEFLAQRLEQDFCRAMGAEPLFVSKQDATDKELVSDKSSMELFTRVVSIMHYVRQIVEQQNGHRLLTQVENGTRDLKDETELQVALEIMLKPRCEALNIDVTREGETGRGLLDFKFSWGNDSKCFLEVKKFAHSRLQHGVELQLPTYLQANSVEYGIFVPIAIDLHTYDAKLAVLRTAIDELNSKKRFQIEMVDIRAWKPDSASKAAELDDASRYDPII